MSEMERKTQAAFFFMIYTQAEQYAKFCRLINKSKGHKISSARRS